MRVVALISGGKDSCYNMMQCVAEGHEIVALANLSPQDKDELDSYMYQTVGHHAIEYYKEAMGLPLFRRIIKGSSVEIGRDYMRNEDDEVEDLHALLNTVMNEIHVDAVSVGAILSNYQRVRVENVCMRLGLTPLAYLWRRDQTELLNEMIESRVEAIIIKVAAMGLKPVPHLGMPISKIYPIMLDLKSKYSLNVCGEGGEFETFTLDCPLFNKKIVVGETELVLHSDDDISPVGYINFKKMHLEEKDEDFISLHPADRLNDLPMKTSRQLHKELDLLPPSAQTQICVVPQNNPVVQDRIKDLASRTISSNDILLISNIFGFSSKMDTESVQCATRTAMDNLKSALMNCGMSLADVFMVHLYVKDMLQFAVINDIYRKYFDINPPSRICVEADIPDGAVLQMDCISSQLQRSTMHVQGISHWAPANIGPYSQSVMVESKVYVAGQIALCPSTMKIIEGGIVAESRLSLRHAQRVLAAICPGLLLHHVTLAICYVTTVRSVQEVKAEWERALIAESESEDYIGNHSSPLLEIVVISGLPRGALVEWQVVAAVPDEDRDDNLETQELEENIGACPFFKTIETRRGEESEITKIVLVEKLVSISKEERLRAFGAIARSKCSKSSESTRWQIFFRTDVYQYSDLLLVLDDPMLGKEIPSYSLVPVCGFYQKDCILSICSTKL